MGELLEMFEGPAPARVTTKTPAPTLPGTSQRKTNSRVRYLGPQTVAMTTVRAPAAPTEP